jgi:predicted nuclease with TOPRIM domain
MKEQLEKRLQSLKIEYEAGQKMLADLDAKQANLRDTLLRISGAIQILEETLNEADNPEAITLSNIDNTNLENPTADDTTG